MRVIEFIMNYKYRKYFHVIQVTLYESMETEMAYYLVLELIRGGEMKDYISKADKLTEKETKKLVILIMLLDYPYVDTRIKL